MSSSLKTGILIAQVGTPADASVSSVKKYLKQFLSDKRVVDLTKIIWTPLLRGIILPWRAPKSARLYKRLFESHGPVLKTHCEALTAAIQQTSNATVRYGMRYGQPSLNTVFQDMAQTCERILVIPLFPQYSHVTTGSVYDAIMETGASIKASPDIRFANPFYNSEEYLTSITSQIKGSLQNRATPPDRLILSYHGLPLRYIARGDPYEFMCRETTRQIRERLDYPKACILHTWQSKFGSAAWLEPHTLNMLTELARHGIKNVMVACPSFTMDCLETLDEIAVEYHKIFLKNGGEQLELVPCLNAHENWISGLSQLIDKELKRWE